MRWVVNATPGSLYLLETRGSHCIGGWVDPRAGLDWCGKSRPHQVRSPDRPASSVVARPTELPRLPEPDLYRDKISDLVAKQNKCIRVLEDCVKK
jgi:hypothetical protein